MHWAVLCTRSDFLTRLAFKNYSMVHDKGVSIVSFIWRDIPHKPSYLLRTLFRIFTALMTAKRCIFFKLRIGCV
jgi:hypothetical protein